MKADVKKFLMIPEKIKKIAISCEDWFSQGCYVGNIVGCFNKKTSRFFVFFCVFCVFWKSKFWKARSRDWEPLSNFLNGSWTSLSKTTINNVNRFFPRVACRKTCFFEKTGRFFLHATREKTSLFFSYICQWQEKLICIHLWWSYISFFRNHQENFDIGRQSQERAYFLKKNVKKH